MVELLTVVSIMLLLVALLLPALKSARNISKSAVCLSNLRQVGLSLHVYAQDYVNYFPSWIGASGDGESIWHRVLANNSYIPQPKVGKGCILVCSAWEPQVYMNSSYTYGLWVGPGSPPTGAVQGSSIPRLSTIYNPSNQIIAGDTVRVAGTSAQRRQWYYLEKMTLAEMLSSSKVAHLRHNNSADIVFLDGSARSVGKSFLTDNGWGYSQ